MDALGITEVLPNDADVRSVGVAVHRVLSQEPRPTTDPCPPPANDDVEQLRLARVAATSLEDGPSDKALQDLVSHTAEAFGVPYVVVSLTLEEGHWFKSHASPPLGSVEARTPAFDSSFCRYVVEAGQPVLISDATMHPTFATNRLVRGGVIGSFAGAPLVTRDGDVLGALCILDVKAGGIAANRVDTLARLAKRIAEDLELRSKARSSALEVIRLNEKLAQERDKHQLSKSGLAQLEAVFAQLDGGVVVIGGEDRVLYANRVAGELLDLPAHRMAGMKWDDFLQECGGVFDEPEAFMSKMAGSRAPQRATAHEFEHDKPMSRMVRWSVKPIELPGGMGQLIALTEMDQPTARAASGRFSVVPQAPAPRSSRAVNARSAPTRAAANGRAKRKG
jgi:PAS domain-containing protein